MLWKRTVVYLQDTPRRLQGSISLAQPHHIWRRCLRVFLHILTGLVAMAPNINASTLFHLVPLNQTARDALLHPDNCRFVSPIAIGDDRRQGELGLEIGFHVPSIPAGHVIARLGRNADLILRERPVSAVHIAFEIHPQTLVTLLSVQSKQSSTVKVTALTNQQHEVDGDCVIVYGQNYTIQIVSYYFELVWRNIGTVESLRALVLREYRNSLQRLQTVRSRHLPTDFSSELHTWHNTRLQKARRVFFREAEGEPRVLIGCGQFGDVYQAVDLESGNAIAVKVIKLECYPDVENARAALHREIKALVSLKHVRYPLCFYRSCRGRHLTAQQKNIIECLNTAKWDTPTPEIFMPLCPGTLRSLARASGRRSTDDGLCLQVLEQMLCALDHLAHRGMCHRDVKPENILYWPEKDKDNGIYHFQLADFGLVNHQKLATTRCGTGYYQAPELFPQYGDFPQSPKMDVWSLFATIIDVHRNFTFPPTNANNYDDVLRAIRAAVSHSPDLADMARENPTHRASAAQLLVAHFAGRGLTTPRATVPPISRPTQETESNIREARVVSTSVARPKAPLVPPLIEYRAHRRQMQKSDPECDPSKPPARQNNPRLPLQTIRPRYDRIVKQRDPSSQPSRRWLRSNKEGNQTEDRPL